MRLVADLACKRINDLRIADVLFLCRDGKLEVTAYEPCDEPRVIRRQSLLQAKRFGVHGSKLGVVATAPFGNVVEESSEIADFGSR